MFLAPTSTKPVVPDMPTNVDVAGIVGSQAFVGFGAGTGGAAGDNGILRWSFTSSQIPEPATGACTLGLLVMVVCGVMTRRH